MLVAASAALLEWRLAADFSIAHEEGTASSPGRVRAAGYIGALSNRRQGTWLAIV